MIHINKILTCLLVLISYLILELQTISDTDLAIQILGWVTIVMFVIVLFILEDDGVPWRYKLKNGVFVGGVTLLTVLFLISILNYFYSSKDTLPEKLQTLEQRAVKKPF